MSQTTITQMITVRVIPSDMEKPVETKRVEDSLYVYKNIIGGWLEVVHLPHLRLTPRARKEVVMVVNEEGTLLGLPLNKRASQLARRPIVGNVFLICEGEEHFSDYQVPELIVGKS